MARATIRDSRTRRRPVSMLWGVVVLCLALLPLPLLTTSSGGQAAVEPRPALLIRSNFTSEFGVSRPTGVAYEPDAEAVLVAAPTEEQRLIRLTPAGEALGAPEAAPGTALTLAFDPKDRSVAMISGRELLKGRARSGRIDADARRAALGEEIPTEAAGATFDAAGTLLLLDGDAHTLVRVPDSDLRGRPDRIPLPELESTDLRGLAFNPADGLYYVGDPANKLLHGVDASGRVQAIYDLADAELLDQQGFTFAPSADQTDDPARMSLFVADSGGTSPSGQLAELALDEPVALAATADTAMLVQTVDSSQWNPPNPDASGIAWLGSRLIVADSEVEEMSIWQGANIFEATTSGSLIRTGNVTPVSNEPTGLSYRASDNTLLISDDNANRITLLKPGGDGNFGTGDDSSTFFGTLPRSDDPEDVAFDPTTGHIFIIDGVNTEVYRVDPGTDGVFGNSNDVWTNFDVGQYGARDPEGIEFNAATNALLVSDGRTEMVYEVTKAGELARTIDIAGAGSVNAASVALAPSSVQVGRVNLWIADRGVDNAADPNENDGRLYEMSFGLPGGNNAPTVQSVTIDQTSPATGDTLTASVVANDPDGDPLTISYQWIKNGVDIPGATGSVLNLADPGNGDSGDAISVRVAAFDGQASSSPLTSATVTVATSTTPPAIESVTIDQTAPRTNDTLTATVVRSDPGGDPLTYNYQWIKNGGDLAGATSPTLDLSVAGNGNKTDGIAVRVTPSAGGGGSGTHPTVSATGAIYNTAGTNRTAHPIPLPAGIAAGDLLVAVFPYDGGSTAVWPVGWTEILDRANSSQGLAIAYRIANGADGTTVTVTTSSEQAVGFVYRITGWHGTAPPEVANTIGSSNQPDPPSLTPSWGSGQTLWIAAYGINGGPTSSGPSVFPLPDNRLRGRTGGGGATGGAVASENFTTATFDPGVFVDTANNTWIAATVAIRPGSGTAPPAGDPVTSAAVTVVDSPPVFAQDLGNQSNLEGAVVSLSAAATDADNDPLTYQATGLPTGLTIASSTGLISGTVAAGASAQSPYATAITVRQGATPDATDSLTWTIGVPTPNNPPTITSVTVNPTAPRTNDTLTATVVAGDPDDDPLTYSYQWVKNGTDIAGATASSLDLSLVGNGSKSDTIAVRVIANDGQDPSAPVTSSTVTILDSPPVFDQDLGNRSSTEGAVVSLSAAATDADNDPLTYEATGLPTGLTIASSTGLISGTVAAGASAQSPYATVITVRQGATPDATDSFTWTVSVPSANPPTVAGTGTVYNTLSTARTAHPLPLPTGVVAGDLLLAVFPYDGGGGASWPVGWTEIRDQANGSQGLAVAYRIANGSDGTTVTVTTASELAVGFVYRITDWDSTTPPQIASAVGSSNQPDPPSLAPTWGSGEALWIAAYGINGGPSSSGPTVYPLPDNRLRGRTGGSGASGGAIASQLQNVSAFNPGVFSDTENNTWIAVTIAVR